MARSPALPAPPVSIPLGFPGCRHCAYRHADAPGVCLRCFDRSKTVSVGRPGSVPLRCGACGRPGGAGWACANPWCTRADRGWSSVFALGAHDGGLRRSLAGYKFRGERWRAGVFARLLADYLRSNPTWFEEYDRLVPMPSYAGPGARRDWDPVGSIFAELTALVGSEWECDAGLVVKTAETPPMSGRSRWERVALAEGALRSALVVPAPERAATGRILVIDDVLTEGSSLREVASALRAAGAEEVAGLVLARRGWAPPPAGSRSRD